MSANAPNPFELHTTELARAKKEADEHIARLRSIFGEIIHAMQGMAEEGFPMELSVVDFKDPVGNAAWREHTRAQGRGPMEMPLMETEDDLLSRLEAV